MNAIAPSYYGGAAIDQWAASQAAPLRRVHIRGALFLFPHQGGSPGAVSLRTRWSTESATQSSTVSSLTARSCHYGALEVTGATRHIGGVTNLQHYQREALKQAKVVRLSAQEGFVAKIPGFKGLLAVGGSRREALLALESALDDWISIKLSRRLSLPSSLREAHARRVSLTHCVRQGVETITSF